MFQAANLAFSANFTDLNTAIFANLASFLDNTDSLKLPILNNQARIEKMPENILEAGFSLKFESLPPYFRSSKLDRYWFNKFKAEEIADETFWITVLDACDDGVDLKSCEGYAEHAVGLLVNYDAQDEITKYELTSNLGAIIRSLIKFKKYDAIIGLMRLNNNNIARKAQVSVGDYDYRHNFTLLEKIVQSVRDEDERIKFIDSIVHIKGPSLVLIYMNYRPEALNRLINMIAFWFEDDYVSRIIFKYYRHDMNHQLVYQFKKALLARHFRPHGAEILHFTMAVEYLHNNVPLTEFSALDYLEKAELALIKGSLPEFFDLVGSLADRTMDDLVLERPLFKLVLDNPDIIRELLRLDSRFFKSYFKLEFEGFLPNDTGVRNLLNAYAEHYADNPGTHEGILIYPGIQYDNDSETGLLNYLKNEISAGGIRRITSDSIIRTIMLTKQNCPQVLEKSILGLIDNSIIRLIQFSPATKLMIWRRANFETFTKLLANERIVKFCPPMFHLLNWDLTDYVKIFRFPKYFDLYYPHRQAVARTFSLTNKTSQLLHHFLRLEEFKAMLAFFDYDYHVPENPFSIIHSPTGLAEKEMAREYKFVLDHCGDDMEKRMKYLNSNLLDSSIIWNEEKIWECENVLGNWFVSPQNHDSLKRFFVVAKSTLKVPFLKVKISSLRIDPGIMKLPTEEGSRMKFSFDIEAILEDLQSISRSDYLEAIRNFKSVSGLTMELLATATSEYPVETLNKLKRFLNGERD